jgi:hypothetical protein
MCRELQKGFHNHDSNLRMRHCHPHYLDGSLDFSCSHCHPQCILLSSQTKLASSEVPVAVRVAPVAQVLVAQVLEDQVLELEGHHLTQGWMECHPLAWVAG